MSDERSGEVIGWQRNGLSMEPISEQDRKPKTKMCPQCTVSKNFTKMVEIIQAGEIILSK